MRSVLLGLLVGAAACGSSGSSAPDGPFDCSQVTGTDTFVVGLDHHGDAGALDFKMMSADPAPPARDDNTWVIEVSSMSSGVVGNPVAGLSIMAIPYMPAHQHGSPKQVIVTPSTSSPGQYTLSPVNMWMPGVWETTITATQGSTTDSTVFRFCIPN
jgi:hypothetical protein